MLASDWGATPSHTHMASGIANPVYFPTFSALPTLDEVDSNYYLENHQGAHTLVPMEPAGAVPCTAMHPA